MVDHASELLNCVRLSTLRHGGLVGIISPHLPLDGVATESDVLAGQQLPDQRGGQLGPDQVLACNLCAVLGIGDHLGEGCEDVGGVLGIDTDATLTIGDGGSTQLLVNHVLGLSNPSSGGRLDAEVGLDVRSQLTLLDAILEQLGDVLGQKTGGSLGLLGEISSGSVTFLTNSSTGSACWISGLLSGILQSQSGHCDHGLVERVQVRVGLLLGGLSVRSLDLVPGPAGDECLLELAS